MKHITIFIIPLIIILAGCNSTNELLQLPQQCDTPQNNKAPATAVLDLDIVVTKILGLIKNGKISEILLQDVKESPSVIDILVKNFSPAEMAFDSEILNSNVPAIVLFYDEIESSALLIQENFEKIAQDNYNRAKFVKIDVSTLFKLADQAMVTTVPTVLAILSKKELGRTKQQDPALLVTEVTELLTKIEDIYKKVIL